VRDLSRRFGQARALQSVGAEGETIMASIKRAKEKLEGRVLAPALLWMAGVPFGLVLLLWFFFFRGR
jgi:hypothetical protein